MLLVLGVEAEDAFQTLVQEEDCISIEALKHQKNLQVMIMKRKTCLKKAI